MKVVLLAGGFGTRISEQSHLRPKPMIEIGDYPILWHIMKYYSSFGHNDFVILLGYKGFYIKEYFSHYYLHRSDVTIDTANSSMEIHKNDCEKWKITLVDTGLHTMTGGRIKKAQKYIGDEPFMLTYGDGLSNVNLDELQQFHENHGKAITMTSVQPEGRFGTINTSDDGMVTKFEEKPKGDGSWINGGFFVCNKEIFDYIPEGDDAIFERAPLVNMAKDGEIFAKRFDGFWKCMDTMRDHQQFTEIWESGKAPWKTW